MADRRDVLLDLSAWPEPEQGRDGPLLPPRPARRRMQLPRATGLVAAVVVACAGLGLLLVPIPGLGCASAVTVWAESPVPTPAKTAPVLDPAEPARDAAAVQAASAALAAWSPAPQPRASSVLTTVVYPASAQAVGRVRELERAVAQDVEEVAAATRRRDAVVEQQQASDDPNAYDAEVAAAQEDLDQARSRLAEDRSALAVARRSARSRVEVVRSPVPAAASSASNSAASRQQRVAALAAAKRTQATHLGQRQQALAAWTLAHQADLARVSAANSALDHCQRRVRGPAAAGALALLAAVPLGVRARRR